MITESYLKAYRVQRKSWRRTGKKWYKLLPLTAVVFEGLKLPGSIDFEDRGKVYEKWDGIRIV